MLFALMRVQRWAAKRLAGLRRWYYAKRPPPFMDVPGIDPLQGAAGEHNITFVSRHHIAECGLTCPHCHKLAAGRGDFKTVRETRMGEAVPCAGCGEVLVAAPDTEHGDDQLPYDAKLFHRFVRISAEKAAQEAYGGDIALDKHGAMTTSRQRLGDIVGMPADATTDPKPDGIPWDEVADSETEELPAPESRDPAHETTKQYRKEP